MVEQFAKLDESASIYEIMKENALSPEIRPIWPGQRMCGTAFTVYTRPGDNLMVHKALSMLSPGDVLVIACESYPLAGGQFGGMMGASAKAKGCVGVVTDGGVRDTMLLKELELPVFSASVNVRYTTKSSRGNINHPVMLGGVLIHPGDLIFADNDGIVAVPRPRAQEVYRQTIEREEREAVLLKRILAGEGTTFELSGFSRMYDALGLSEEPLEA